MNTTRWELQSFDPDNGAWVSTPMTDPNPLDGSRCADQVVAACEAAPDLYSRRFRVLQIMTTTTVATRSWIVKTPTRRDGNSFTVRPFTSPTEGR